MGATQRASGEDNGYPGIAGKRQDQDLHDKTNAHFLYMLLGGADRDSLSRREAMPVLQCAFCPGEPGRSNYLSPSANPLIIVTGAKAAGEGG